MTWQLIRSSAATVQNVLRCSSAALSENTLPAAYSKASAYQVSARASGERKEFCGARFDCRHKGEQESRFFKNEHELLLLLRQLKKKWRHLGDSTRNGKFKRLEPQFQVSATIWGWQRSRKLLSRECTKEPICALPNNRSMEKFGARAELRNIVQEKLRGRGGSSC